MQNTSHDDAALVHVLDEPIMIEGEPRSEIVFRKPTGGDILMYGNPVRCSPLTGIEGITFDEKKMFAMMWGLSGVPEPFLKKLSPNDTVEIFWGLARFFIPGMRRKDPSKAPDAPPAG